MKKQDNLPSLMYKILRPILGTIFKLYYNPKIIGKENIPQKGPILIVGNHKHIMDQCGPIISTKRVIHYMAKKEYFDGKFAWFFKMTGCISVNRGEKDQKAKDKALMVLKEGGAIGIFPEGTRNRTKELLLPFKYGAVSMAQKTDAYLVPVIVTGDYKFRSENLTYQFGKPFKVDNMELSDANQKLYLVIEKLLKQK